MTEKKIQENEEEAEEEYDEDIDKQLEELERTLTKEQKEIVDTLWGFIKRYAPWATPEDFKKYKRKKEEEMF
ncbi:MAG: hypothetical protein ACE5KE_10830 [Methanosarcinales archaeon]